MKAFFHRLHIGGGTKDKEKDKEREVQKEKFPPLRPWPPEQPPAQQQQLRDPNSPASLASFKPLPEITPSPLSTRPLPVIEDPESNHSTPTPTPPYPTDHLPSDPARSARKPTSGTLSTAAANDVQKKVAFISPPPTPVIVDRTLPDAPAPAATPPLKTTLSRFQAAHGKEPRVSLSTAASSSKTDVATKSSAKATSTRTASPYLQKPEAASAASLRSGTPYSQMSSASGSRILAATSWSEVTEDDLVSNIGSRERTRQEVLFEIISSEERCAGLHLSIHLC